MILRLLSIILLFSLLFSCSQTIPKTDGTYEGIYYGGLYGNFRIDVKGEDVNGYVVDGAAGQAEVYGTFLNGELKFKSDTEIVTLQADFIGEIDGDGKVSGKWTINYYKGVFQGEKL